MAWSSAAAKIDRLVPKAAYTVCTATPAREAMAAIDVDPYPLSTNKFHFAAITIFLRVPARALAPPVDCRFSLHAAEHTDLYLECNYK